MVVVVMAVVTGRSIEDRYVYVKCDFDLLSCISIRKIVSSP